jgi:hypothetical protein
MGFIFSLIRSGLLLSLTAVLLQIAVFLQPLLPAQYQVAPVCETIAQALLHPNTENHSHHSTVEQQHTKHHHDANHQCQYCTVYGNLVLPPELSVKEVLDRIQVHFAAWQNSAAYIWFVLQRLFLLPQGRAPPLFT